MAFTAPDWLEVADAQLVLVAAIVALFLAAVLSFNLVRRLSKLVLVMAVIVVLAVMLSSQWVNLRDCYETCDCSLFSWDISVPDNVLCGEDRVRIDS